MLYESKAVIAPFLWQTPAFQSAPPPCGQGKFSNANAGLMNINNVLIPQLQRATFPAPVTQFFRTSDRRVSQVRKNFIALTINDLQ